MKLLLTLLLLLGCSRSSPLAEPEDYQYDESDSELELEETDSDHIDIQIISQSKTVEGRIGEKVVLPCRVEPEGIVTLFSFNEMSTKTIICAILLDLDSSIVNRVWVRPDTENNQILAIGNKILHEPQQEFAVEGSNFIILKVSEKHVGQYRCTVSGGQVTHTLALKSSEDVVARHSSERITSNTSNTSSILSHSLYLVLLLLFPLLLL